MNIDFMDSGYQYQRWQNQEWVPLSEKWRQRESERMREPGMPEMKRMGEFLIFPPTQVQKVRLNVACDEGDHNADFLVINIGSDAYDPAIVDMGIVYRQKYLGIYCCISHTIEYLVPRVYTINEKGGLSPGNMDFVPTQDRLDLYGKWLGLIPCPCENTIDSQNYCHEMKISCDVFWGVRPPKSEENKFRCPKMLRLKEEMSHD